MPRRQRLWMPGRNQWLWRTVTGILGWRNRKLHERRHSIRLWAPALLPTKNTHGTLPSQTHRQNIHQGMGCLDASREKGTEQSTMGEKKITDQEIHIACPKFIADTKDEEEERCTYKPRWEGHRGERQERQSSWPRDLEAIERNRTITKSHSDEYGKCRKD